MMQLMHIIGIIERLDNILELIDYLRCGATVVSGKFDIMGEKIHDNYLRIPIIGDTGLSTSIKEAETLAQTIKGFIIQFKRDVADLQQEIWLHRKLRHAAKRKRLAY